MLITVNGVAGTKKSVLAQLLSDDFQVPLLDEQAEVMQRFNQLCFSLHDLRDTKEVVSLTHFILQSQILNFKKGLNLSAEYNGSIVVSHPLAFWYTSIFPLYKENLFSRLEALDYLEIIKEANLPIASHQVNLILSPMAMAKRLEAQSSEDQSLDTGFLKNSVLGFTHFAVEETRTNLKFSPTESIGIDTSNKIPPQIVSELKDIDFFQQIELAQM